MEEDSRVPKKTPLLRKLDIPIERLGYSYVRKCSDVRELEKILRILRSGEEGHFPELITFVEQRLKGLDPANRHLRIQLPILRSQHLDKEERNGIVQDISEWIDTISKSPRSSEQNNGESNDIFDFPNNQIPIRGHGRESSNVKEIDKKESGKEVRNPNSKGIERIKSWEYDKWDKFDVEEELTRIDVVDMQTEEWEKVQKPRITAQQRHGGGVEELMKNLDQQQNIQTSSLSASQPKINSCPPLMDISTPSFMEEISEDKPSIPSKPKVPAPRRFRVEIEDVHVPF